MDTLKEELAEILEVETVNDTDVLEEFECWDSLTMLSIIALASDRGKTIGNEQITKSKTIAGLLELINS